MSALIFLLDARPFFTNNAVVLGLLMSELGLIFHIPSLDSPELSFNLCHQAETGYYEVPLLNSG